MTPEKKKPGPAPSSGGEWKGFLKRPGPAPGTGGRPPFPPEKKKERRVVVYAVPATAEKIRAAGGSQFVSGLVERELGT